MSLLDLGSALDLGPQSATDDPFTARIRRHQSWYRAAILGLPFGTGPQPSSTSSYGNMLRREDGGRGSNFLNDQIFKEAQRRLATGTGTVEAFRLLHNMLSSQPMCFNLFAPLIDDLALATILCRATWGDHIKRVTRVELEWAPEPAAEFLADRTAFDAFIEYDHADGGRGFVCVEAKLTEPFSNRHYDQPAYRRWMVADSPWREDAASAVDRVEHNQLWRDHLLAWSLLKHPRSRHEHGLMVVVHHPGDDRCMRTVDAYRSLLRDDSTLATRSLADVVAAWKPHLGRATWLREFELRYLALDRSEQAVGRSVVSEGHLHALSQIEEGTSYNTTRDLYRAQNGLEVYLRPTDSGFTVLSLDAERCASMVGVGARESHQHRLVNLSADPELVRAAVVGYGTKIASLGRASDEERYALALVRGALSSSLRLPRLDTYFIHQEWRLPDGNKIDLLGVEPSSGRLVVIELKASEAGARKSDPRKGGDAWAQSQSYADTLYRYRDRLYPFFERLGRALARHHGSPPEMPSLRLDPAHLPLACVSWPGGDIAPGLP